MFTGFTVCVDSESTILFQDSGSEVQLNTVLPGMNIKDCFNEMTIGQFKET